MNIYSDDVVSSLIKSRPFDVHRWSEYPEVDFFIDQLWLLYGSSTTESVKTLRGRPVRAPKRYQLKGLLLDIYVCWCEDPSQYIGIHANNSKWSRGRYRALHLSKSILTLLKWLVDEGYVEKIQYWHSTKDPRNNRTSRYRASAKLQALFNVASFGIDDLYAHPNKECIVLKDKASDEDTEDDGKAFPVDYEDIAETVEMRRQLTLYNELLQLTHIDLGTLERPVIHRTISKGKHRGKRLTIYIGQHNKHVRRIFSRNSWDMNGRFYGGWWQQINKDTRRDILINGNPTVEVDFKGMHIAMLNAKLDAPATYDPYRIDSAVFPDIDIQTQRDWTKRLVLCAINADSRKSAYAAFREQSETGSAEKRLTNQKLDLLLDVFVEKNPHLKSSLLSDAGIRLMNLDGKITALIIKTLTAKGIPVLTIHDSYIVERHHFSALRLAMIEASLRYCRRNLIAEQEGFDVDFSDGQSMNWAIINEEAVNKLPRKGPCEGFRARFERYCDKVGVTPVKTNRGRGLMASSVVALI
jgi:hypothetical protein